MLTRGTSATQTRSGREADNTTPMRTIFLSKGSASAIHQHQEHAAWFHVVSGEIVEDRCPFDLDMFGTREVKYRKQKDHAS